MKITLSIPRTVSSAIRVSKEIIISASIVLFYDFHKTIETYESNFIKSD